MQLTAANIPFTVLDLFLFGEIVPLFDENNPNALQFIRNETQSIGELVDSMID